MRFVKSIVHIGLSLSAGVAMTQAVEWGLAKFSMCLSCSYLVGLTSLLSIIVYFVQGLFADGFLLKKAVLEMRGIGAKVCVRTGDLFKQDGVIVVAVNDFFDTLVDDIHIRKASVHGQTILRFWPGNVAELDEKIDAALQGKPFETVMRDGRAKTKRYPIGTSIYLSNGNGKRFIFVALTTTDPQTHMTSATLDGLIAAVRGTLVTARHYANGACILFPLMGSGTARLNLPHIALLSTILSAILAESNRLKVSDEIDIVLRGELAAMINYSAIKEMWRV